MCQAKLFEIQIEDSYNTFSGIHFLRYSQKIIWQEIAIRNKLQYKEATVSPSLLISGLF